VTWSQIRKIRSELTVVDGRIVHDAGKLTGRPGPGGRK